MSKRGLWYSLDELDSAMKDLKDKLRPVYRGDDNFDDWWNKLTFKSYNTRIEEEFVNIIKEPGYLEKGIRRILKAVPALACCLGEHASELISEIIFNGGKYSSEQIADIGSSFEELSESYVIDIFKDYFVSPAIICGIVSVATLFSTIILDKAIYGKGWRKSIFEALKNSGIWSAAYVSGAVGGVAGLLFQKHVANSKLGGEAINVSVSVATLSFSLIGVKFLAAKVIKIIGYFRQREGNAANENVEMEVGV